MKKIIVMTPVKPVLEEEGTFHGYMCDGCLKELRDKKIIEDGPEEDKEELIWEYYFADNDIDFSEIEHDSHGRYKEKDLNKKLCIKEYDDAIIKEYIEIVKLKYGKKKTICFCAMAQSKNQS